MSLLKCFESAIHVFLQAYENFESGWGILMQKMQTSSEYAYHMVILINLNVCI